MHRNMKATLPLLLFVSVLLASCANTEMEERQGLIFSRLKPDNVKAISDFLSEEDISFHVKQDKIYVAETEIAETRILCAKNNVLISNNISLDAYEFDPNENHKETFLKDLKLAKESGELSEEHYAHYMLYVSTQEGESSK